MDQLRRPDPAVLPALRPGQAGRVRIPQAGRAREHDLQRPLDELAAALDGRNLAEGGKQNLRFSVGTTGFDSARHASIADLIQEADERMYEAKQNRKRFFGVAV